MKKLRELKGLKKTQKLVGKERGKGGKGRWGRKMKQLGNSRMP